MRDNEERNLRLLGVHKNRQDVYPYDPTPPNKDVVTIEWYVNFADPNLFYAYGSSLFAQGTPIYTN